MGESLTRSELARDKLRLWSYIGRCQRIGMPIPEKWLKYGMPPSSASTIIDVCLDSIVDKTSKIFDQDSDFYESLRRGKR